MFKRFSTFFCCFSFGGYGAEIAYSESLSTDTTHSDSWSIEVSVGVAFKADLELLFFSIGPTFSFEVGVTTTDVVGESTETSKSVSRSRGFALSDPEEYDVFDVEVCSVLETFFLV